ncbi:MAG: leucine-rich repeat domain-containing protein [Lentisphaeria bacterium]|nr:leucine-rich repeat domain-containing protein [Lentisphaeria bacterium]
MKIMYKLLRNICFHRMIALAFIVVFGVVFRSLPLFAGDWQRELKTAKEQGMIFSEDNRTLLKVPEKVTSVVIPSCVTAIGENAFYKCHDLSTLTIPGGVESIGKEAFLWCRRLKQIEISEGVKSIGEKAFANCRNLKKLELPVTAVEIDAEALLGVPQIILPAGHPLLQDKRTGYLTLAKAMGIEFSEDNKKLIRSPRHVTKVLIPYGVTEIGVAAFFSCFSLEEVYIPETVTEIHNKAFSLCKKLKAVKLPPRLKLLGYGAFSYCSSLREISIPGTVDTIKATAFSGCKNLRKLEIKNGVRLILHGAFSGCDSLTEVTTPRSVEFIDRMAFRCKKLKKASLHYKNDYVKNGCFKTFPDHCRIYFRRGAY